MAVRFAPPPDGRIFVAEKSGVVIRRSTATSATPPRARGRPHARTSTTSGTAGCSGWRSTPPSPTNAVPVPALHARRARSAARPRVARHLPGPARRTTAGCVVSARAGPRSPSTSSASRARSSTLIGDQWCQHFPSHSIGTVAFGPDGMLYAGAGDGRELQPAPTTASCPAAATAPPNPCGDPPQEGGALRAQDVRTHRRTRPASTADPAASTRPPAPRRPGNPFADGPTPNARRIIAYGLRNPFRFAFRPGTTEIWVGDVGWMDWEEIDRIADATDGGGGELRLALLRGRRPPVVGWDLRLPLCTSLSRTPGHAAGAYTLRATAGESVARRRLHAGPRAPRSPAIAFPTAYALRRAPTRERCSSPTTSGACLFAMRAGADGAPGPRRRRSCSPAAPAARAGRSSCRRDPAATSTTPPFDPEHPDRGSVHRIRLGPRRARRLPAVVAAPDAGGRAARPSRSRRRSTTPTATT